MSPRSFWQGQCIQRRERKKQNLQKIPCKFPENKGGTCDRPIPFQGFLRSSGHIFGYTWQIVLCFFHTMSRRNGQSTSLFFYNKSLTLTLTWIDTTLLDREYTDTFFAVGTKNSASEWESQRTAQLLPTTTTCARLSFKHLLIKYCQRQKKSQSRQAGSRTNANHTNGLVRQ